MRPSPRQSASATSPAVVMRITADLGAEGQVTERTLLLTALKLQHSRARADGADPLLTWSIAAAGGPSCCIPLYLLGDLFRARVGGERPDAPGAAMDGNGVEVQVLALVALILVTVAWR